jgi:hypothetical protein
MRYPQEEWSKAGRRDGDGRDEGVCGGVWQVKWLASVEMKAMTSSSLQHGRWPIMLHKPRGDAAKPS